MAFSNFTPQQEFIKSSFCPLLAVSTSPDSEAICQKNNLSFVELIQPFCELGTEAHYKDPSGTTISIRNFKVGFVDINYQPPQENLARVLLKSAVAHAHEPNTIKYENGGNTTLNIPEEVPWFDAWRETFLDIQYPSDHEFTKHIIGCVFVISSNDENPMELVHQMYQTVNQMQTVSSNKFPKWFNSNILRYFLVLDDKTEEKKDTAVAIYKNLQSTYGKNNACLIRINTTKLGKSEELPDVWNSYINIKFGYSEMGGVNSLESGDSAMHSSQLEVGKEVNENNSGSVSQIYHPLSPENEEMNLSQSLTQSEIHFSIPKTNSVFHGACLSVEDRQQIKYFIHELCVRSLIPYMESQIHYLNDMVSNKKGVSRSLLNVTMRWLTPNKPGSGAAIPNNAVVYASDELPLQRRRLADLYFMTCNYNAAFKTYHSAKKEFQADQAWLYYAGALEMAALSAFMDNASTEKTLNYMEEAIETYLITCNTRQFATRATIMSTECLEGCNMHGEAAKQFNKMTSGESDLSSALLLEQAAYCFLRSAKPMIRKYAFHMVFAGHRYSKTSQKKHSLRCYEQALQVYENKGWNLADDHIYYTLGKQASNLKLMEEAAKYYSKLLVEESKQSSVQQGLYFKEYILTHNLINTDFELSVLPLPLVDCEATKVLVGPRLPLRTPGKVFASGITLASHDDMSTTQRWHKLEELVVQEAQGSVPMIMKPLVTLFTNENVWAGNPMAIIGEPVQVSIKLRNPLQITLHLKEIYLLWNFKSLDKLIDISNETDSDDNTYLKTHFMKYCVLQPNCKQEIILSLTPLVEGNIIVKGICYFLCNSVNQDEQIKVKGKKLLTIKAPKIKKKEKPGATKIRMDRRLDINVKPPASCLEVSFCEINTELLCNELQQILIELKNVGDLPLHNIYMATSVPHLLSSCEFQGSLKESSNFDTQIKRNHVTRVPLPDKKLEHGKSYQVSIWLKAPEVKGPMLLDLLIYYENIDSTLLPKYRTVRHTWQLSIQESINVEVMTNRSENSKNVEQMTMSIICTNTNQIHHAVSTEITPLQASLFSKNWILNEKCICPSNIKLTSQEFCEILLKALRKDNVTNENSFSNVSLCMHEQITKQSNKAFLDFGRRSDKNKCTIFELTENTPRVVEPTEAVLILRWHALVTDSAGNKRSVVGQNHIKIDKINKPDKKTANDNNNFVVFVDRMPERKVVSKETSITSLHKQISYNFLHPVNYEHNFLNNRLCIINVKLLIHSCSEESLVVCIKTLGAKRDSNNSNRPALFYPYSSRHFRWIGGNGIVKTIPPFKSIPVDLSVAVLTPGTYDLGGRIEVWCHRIDQPNTPVLQVCRVKSALIVTNENSS